MKHVWTIRGTYFDWEMVVKVRPAAEAPMRITEDDQGSAIGRMKRMSKYFYDVVNLHEFSLEFDRLCPGIGGAEAFQLVPGEADAGQGGGD